MALKLSYNFSGILLQAGTEMVTGWNDNQHCSPGEAPERYLSLGGGTWC